MKTIKERAKEYAPGISNSDSLFSIRISTLAAVERIGYIAGATEQKDIDIEKACEWFADYLMEIGYPDDWMRDSPNMASGKERFIKAMEKAMEEEK